MVTNMSLFSVNAILILSTDDKSRLLAKYYQAPHAPTGTGAGTGGSGGATGAAAAAGVGSSHPGANPYPTLKEQKAFEKGLMEKTNKTSNDVILYDNRIVVYKMENDVMLYVVGGPQENEILLFSVVLALRDSLAMLLKNSTDKRTIIENYDLVSLAIDEIIDDGVVLETDPVVVSSRVTKPPQQDMPNMKNIDLSEQGIANMWDLGKKMLADRVRQGL